MKSLHRICRRSALCALALLASGTIADAAIITVSTAADEVNGNTSSIASLINSPGGSGISLREAIIACNNTPGADQINLPAGTYTLTLVNTNADGSDENFAAQGDLDIRDTVTIIGSNGNSSGNPANTIIQAGTTRSNGIDKVFSLNQDGTTAASAIFKAVTIRYGRNTNACDYANFFGHFAGGIDAYGGVNPSGVKLTVTNCVITDNIVANSCAPGVGAGINMDEGDLEIRDSTIANNETSNQPGGGISFFSSSRTLLLENCIITGNKAQGGATGEGGGLFVSQISSGTVVIRNCAITNNTSESRGGGIALGSPGANNATIANTTISGNVSTGTGGGISEGGGLDNSIGGGVTTLTNVTIADNHSNGEAGNPGDPGTGGGVFNGLGNLNLSYCRIAGNTAPTGSALTQTGGAVTASNNWWGVNSPADVISGPVTFTPWLMLNLSASPASVLTNKTSTLTAHFLTNSAGAAVVAGNLTVLQGQSITFASDALGIIPSPVTTISGGTASRTFTAGQITGLSTVSAQIDAQTNTAQITISEFPVTPPQLTIAANGTVVVISWPDAYGAYALQFTPSLLSPPATNNWTNYPGPFSTNAGNIFVTNNPALSNRFYRLAN